jgi:hypothetical protein
MKSVLWEVVQRSSLIYVFLSLFLIVSVVLDIAGVAGAVPKEAFGEDSVFFIPTLLAIVYSIAPALLLRFALIGRPIHWGLATLYVFVSYFIWFVIMAALSGEPYTHPSYTLLLSLIAAWRILRFQADQLDNVSEKIGGTNASPPSAFAPAPLKKQSASPLAALPIVAAANPETKDAPISQEPAPLLPKDRMLQGIAVVGALVCFVLLAACVTDWHDFESKTEAASFLVVLLLPAAFSPVCHLLGLRTAGLLLLLPAAVACVVFAVDNYLQNGTANLAAISAIVSLSTFIFAKAMRRESPSTNHL